MPLANLRPIDGPCVPSVRHTKPLQILRPICNCLSLKWVTRLGVRQPRDLACYPNQPYRTVNRCPLLLDNDSTMCNVMADMPQILVCVRHAGNGLCEPGDVAARGE
jgi:hypothetical protein